MKYTPGPLKSSEQNPFCPVLLLVFGAGDSVNPLPCPGSVHFLVFLVSLKIRKRAAPSIFNPSHWLGARQPWLGAGPS